MKVALRHIQQSLRRRWRYEWQGARRFAIIVLLLVLYSFSAVLDDYLGGHMLSFWFKARGTRPLSAPIEIIAIDDFTYKERGLSILEPFPRELIAGLLEKLSAAKARLVVLDLFFLSQGKSAEVDARLAAAMKNVPSVIGKFALPKKDRNKKADQDKNTLPELEEFLPQPIFANSAKDVVLLEVTPNPSGLATQLALPPMPPNPFLSAVKGAITAGQMPLDLLLVVRWLEALERIPLFRPLQQEFGFSAIPDEHSLINYYGGPETIPTISFHDALEAAGKDFFNKVVFVGAEMDSPAIGSFGNDSFATPASGKNLFGVEYHATIAANLIEGSWLRTLSDQTEGAVVPSVLILLFFFSLYLRPGRAIVLMVISEAAWFAASYIALTRYNFFLPGSSTFLVVMPVLLVTTAVFHYRSSSKALRDTREAFGMRLE